MSAPQLRMLMQYLRRMVEPAGSGPVSDAHLLERWTAQHDEAAFELLVRRHGPMVVGVCRRLLRDPEDVEDAFQATFLVLVTKAGSIGKGTAVASWLYKVAFRVALRARDRKSRQAVPMADVDLPAPARGDEALWRDMRKVLDEEVQGLPARYREVFVLCHLHGMTNREAARECGLPLGTLLSRLSRARERLRRRLSRRGVTLSVGALTAGLATETPAAGLPLGFLSITLRAALCGAAEKAVSAGVLSVQAAALTKGVLQAMWITKIKMVVATTLSVAVLGSGGVATYRGVAAGQAGGSQSVPQPKETAQVSTVAGTTLEIENLKVDLVALRMEQDKLERQLVTVRLLLQKKTDEKAHLEAKVREVSPTLQLLKSKDGLAGAKRAQLLVAAEQLLARLREYEAGRGTLDILLDAHQAFGDALKAEHGRATSPGHKAAPTEKVTHHGSPIRSEERTEEAQDEVDLIQAQLTVKRAQLEAARVILEAAKQRCDRLAKLRGAISSEEIAAAEQEMARVKAEYQVKQAELMEPEVRLKHALRRLKRLKDQDEESRKQQPRPAAKRP